MPDWIVVGAGTGGTSATIGRYLRYRRHAHPAVRRRSRELGLLPVLRQRTIATFETGASSRIEGSGGRGSSPRSCPAWWTA